MAKASWQKTLDESFSKIDGDLEFLLGCLRETLLEMGEKELAKVLPGGKSYQRSKALPPRAAQALSIVFQLLNIIEENAALQAMRLRENTQGSANESGLWHATLKQLKEAKVGAEEIRRRLASQSIDPVLTGHPTEAKRWTVLDLHRSLYLLLVQLENRMFTEAERNDIREELKTVLEQLWRTGEILMTKPDVRSERRNALYYFRERFPDVLDRLDRRLRRAWEESGYAEKAGPLEWEGLPKLRFGSWVGGDRDGHPLVTADVTKETLEELHDNALEVIDRRLATLEKRFGLSIYGQPTPLLLADRIKCHMRDLGTVADERLRFYQEEPWRGFVALMRLKLPSKANAGSSALYQFPSQLADDLKLLAAALEEIDAGRLVRYEVEPTQRVVETFGFHLAALDVRQNSGFHERALAQLLDAAGLDGTAFLKAGEAERLELLESELKSMRPFSRRETPLGAEASAVLDCYRVIAKRIERHGRAGLGALIISMTRGLADLLVVYLLAREAGLLRQTPEGPVCLLPVVPLFETIDDLQNSPGIMEAFLAHPITQRSLAYQHPRYDEAVADRGFLHQATEEPVERIQEVMLGYSDSNKDSGIVASQWALQEAQQALLEVGTKAGVGMHFFHGRGGTVSRGAGPTHRFLEALPPGSLDAGLRVTEQGETVAQKFTNQRTATYNLELLLAGTVAGAIKPNTQIRDARLNTIMDKLSADSRTHYRGLLTHPDFIPFYRQATPIDALEKSRIGSRPSRRTGQASLDDLRAIPWVFSWNQSRFYLPGWFGAGAALQELRTNAAEDYTYLSEHIAVWPFLRYLLLNIETCLASADEKLMRAYAGLVEDEKLRRRLYSRIREEFHRTRDEVELIMKGSLEARRPRFFKTLALREEPLNLLHHEQIRLLKTWRAASKKEAEELLPSLLLSINAIAAGLRTTG